MGQERVPFEKNLRNILDLRDIQRVILCVNLRWRDEYLWLISDVKLS